MTTDHEALIDAWINRGEAELFRLIADGADINGRDKWGETLLSKAITLAAPNLYAPDSQPWLKIITALIDLGADPTLLDDEGMSTLTSAIFEQGDEMLELLLSRGVDPNRGCGDPWETVYDMAEFDYRYEVYTIGLTGVEAPAWDAQSDEDTWLRQLDQHAEAHGLTRPTLLLLLRRYGALSGREMARKLGGAAGDPIVWRDDRWQLRDSTCEPDAALWRSRG